MINFQSSAEEKDFEQCIVEFISNVEYSELITINGDAPHIRPMVYVNRGLTIYMATPRDTAKVKQIRLNPHVSVMIIKSFQAAEHTKEVIIDGMASLVADQEKRNWVFEAFKKKPLTFQEWAESESLEEYEIIEIKPYLVKYFDYAEGESAPKVLKLA
jgi:general stress protein 26